MLFWTHVSQFSMFSLVIEFSLSTFLMLSLVLGWREKVLLNRGWSLGRGSWECDGLWVSLSPLGLRFRLGSQLGLLRVSILGTSSMMMPSEGSQLESSWQIFSQKEPVQKLFLSNIIQLQRCQHNTDPLPYILQVFSILSPSHCHLDQSQPMISSLNSTQPSSNLELLEQSLKAMQARIQYLLKEESKNQKQIQRTLKASINKIGHKMDQVEVYEEMRNLSNQKDIRKNKLHKDILGFKDKQNRELSQIKQSLKALKKSEFSNVKEVSRKNQSLMDQNRRKNLERKKENIQHLRLLKQESRNEIHKQKEQREIALETQKMEMAMERENKRSIIEMKLKELADLELELQEKICESKATSSTIEKVTGETERVPKEEFYKFIKEVKRENKGVDEERVKEIILEKFIQLKLREPSKKTLQLSHSFSTHSHRL